MLLQLMFEAQPYYRPRIQNVATAADADTDFEHSAKVSWRHLTLANPSSGRILVYLHAFVISVHFIISR